MTVCVCVSLCVCACVVLLLLNEKYIKLAITVFFNFWFKMSFNSETLPHIQDCNWPSGSQQAVVAVSLVMLFLAGKLWSLSALYSINEFSALILYVNKPHSDTAMCYVVSICDLHHQVTETSGEFQKTESYLFHNIYYNSERTGSQTKVKSKKNQVCICQRKYPSRIQ